MFEQNDVAMQSRTEDVTRNFISCITSTSFWTPQTIVDSAWLDHAPFGFWLTETVRPKVFVELGTHTGFSFLVFCQAVQRLRLPTACYAVDMWEGDDHAGFHGEHIFDHLESLQGRYYATFSRLIRARFDEALAYFADGEIDLLHIDGRHGYEDALEDYTSWLPKLSERAVVLFHEINVRERDFGVWRLWDELRDKHPSFDFIHGHGLGILCPGPIVPAGLLRLLETRGAARTAVRDAYARLGAGISTQFLLEQAHARLGMKDAAAAQLQQQLHSLDGRLQDAERRRQAAEQAGEENLRQVEVRRRQLEDNLRRTEECLRGLSLQLSALSENESRLIAEASESGTLLVGLRNELVARDAERQLLHANLAAACNELSFIKSSTAWRATGIMRSFGSRIPGSVRRQLRRGAKALWWAVTPHRIPARIRLMRARNDGSPAFAAAGASSEASEATEASEANEASALPRSYIDYHPIARAAGAMSGECHTLGKGSYVVASTPPGYVYIPPRCADDIEQQIAALKIRPTFSIVVPLYNTPDDLFRRMTESVFAQWYAHWELILVDDKSPHQSVREALATLGDPRIKSVLLNANKGISGATNEGLARATGDYIVFLDHDGELTDDCLFELAKSIAESGADYVYSDEDKIMPDGRFGQPFFKPDWSPDTMMSTMYTCHISCVKCSLLEAVGGLRSEFDGRQHWDFLLRVVEKAQHIAHVPKVLYHWRVPASVASDVNAKPCAIDAARRARVDALERRGLSGTVAPVAQLPGYFRVKYDMRGTPLISIIIPSRDNGSVLWRCLDTIFQRSSYANFEIILLDNGSKDPETVAYLDSLHSVQKVRVISHDAPFNYSEINNIGAREAKGSVLLFLNDDTEVISPDWLSDMTGYAQLEHIGAVGAKLLYPETRRIQHSGIVNLAEGPNHAFLLRDADDPCYFARNLIEYNWIAVTGACLMVERSKFNAIGGFDEAFPLAYNDVDLCFRLIDSGLYNVVCPAVELVHHESLSRGLDNANEQKRIRLEQEKLRLYRKHPHYLMHDPFHNPNLSPNDQHFSSACA